TLKFVVADAGKTIYIGGAGAAGATLMTTISSYTNPTTVVLTNSPSTSIVGAPVFVGSFTALDTSTNTAGETRSVVNYPMRFLRCNLSVLTGGTSVSCGFDIRGQ